MLRKALGEVLVHSNQASSMKDQTSIPLKPHTGGVSVRAPKYLEPELDAVCNVVDLTKSLLTFSQRVESE